MVKGESAEDYVFTGKEYDAETGLIYFGGRYYSPALGRWITPDPLFLEKDPTKSIEMSRELNLYAYVQDNPMTYRDATGFRADAGLEDGTWYGKLDDMGKSMPRMNARAAELIATDALALAPVAGPLMIAGVIEGAPVIAGFLGRHPDMAAPIVAGILGGAIKAMTGEQTGLPGTSAEGQAGFLVTETIFTGMEKFAEKRVDAHAQRWQSFTNQHLISNSYLEANVSVMPEFGVSIELVNVE